MMCRVQALAICLLVALSQGLSWVAARADTGGPDFRFEIRPILAKNCFACHGPDEGHRAADLRLDDRDVAVAFGAIDPGAPDESEMVRRITSEDPEERMPPPETGRQLQAEEIEKIKQWIAAGAEYSRHWSYEPPVRPTAPEVSRPDWCRNPIDAFVLEKLDEAGLAPEPEADRHRLIRRLSLDLIGLPPTPEEADAFANDHREDAYEQLVDRLLASPAYGEHWARKWLDLARYADTCGYEKDTRRTIWPYRDWVIRALNDDMPFDQFTVEQLAGDLLPDATKDQIIATAFHRNTMQNDEGGTDDEEFRVAAVVDRVATTMQVWMGTTMGCCQCHSHKYDPLTQKEFYELFAFFNQTADADRFDQEPTLLTPSAEQVKLKAELDQQLADVTAAYATAAEATLNAQRQWEQQIAAEIPWRPLQLTEVASSAGATCTLLDDGSVLVSGAAADTDTYTVRGRTDLSRVTALRLEALPDASLPQGGPGRAVDGGFILSRVRVVQEPWRPTENVRYVRVELPDRHEWLTLAEVQVFRGDENIAPAGTATQSSTAFEGWAHLAIDGRTNPDFAQGRSISHTAFDFNPWWEVDLGAPSRVDRVAIWNTDAHPLRLAGCRVTLLDAERTLLWQGRLIYSPILGASLTVGEPNAPQIALAGAETEQTDFPARHAIENHDPATHGWSPDPRADGPQALTLGFDEPVVGDGPVELRVVLDQLVTTDEHRGRTLGRFRLQVTDDPRARNAATVPPAIREIARVAPADRSDEQAKQIREYYRGLVPELKQLAAKREDIERRLENYRPDKTPIMKELPPTEARKTHVHIRGSFLSKGEEVQPDTPEIFPPFPADAPRNRLGLAKWLVDRRNPLTARVVANRQWEQLFGNGLVLTSEDFGSQGTLPSHPELLDWLAVELMDHGWSLKQLTKTIVMSAAYRQSSRITPEKLAADPENRLISRGPRHRLTAEQIRDQALFVSELLSRKMFGPSVMPPQPDGVWQVVYSDEKWLTSTGEDRYRRGLYTFWRRTSPYPSAMALDATSRETCTIRRVTTNTPVAAFALLNDPAYVEAAQALARRIVEHAGGARERADFALRHVLVRPPTEAEVDRIVALYEQQHEHYDGDRAAAAQLCAPPTNVASEPVDTVELAAWTVVGNVLLNLDETLTK